MKGNEKMTMMMMEDHGSYDENDERKSSYDAKYDERYDGNM